MLKCLKIRRFHEAPSSVVVCSVSWKREINGSSPIAAWFFCSVFLWRGGGGVVRDLCFCIRLTNYHYNLSFSIGHENSYFHNISASWNSSNDFVFMVTLIYIGYFYLCSFCVFEEIVCVCGVGLRTGKCAYVNKWV